MSLRETEAESIRAFVQGAADQGYLAGRVLDYGCGKQPWREIVRAAGGEYLPFDRADYPASLVQEDVGGDELLLGAYDTVLTTQTIQYWLEVEEELSFLRTRINDGGALIITGPTNWPWVEREDRRRYTPTEIKKLLYRARFQTVTVAERPAYQCDGLSWLLGWGAVAIA